MLAHLERLRTVVDTDGGTAGRRRTATRAVPDWTIEARRTVAGTEAVQPVSAASEGGVTLSAWTLVDLAAEIRREIAAR
jgi:hypothetical protein